MLLSDIFSIPFLICLAICILLIGCSSIYFYQRITQQDHKIASMVSLLSSMAEEPLTTTTTHTPVPLQMMGCPIQTRPSQVNRIPVSDDDESSDSSSDEDEDDNSEYSATSSKNENENENEQIDLSGSDFDILPLDLDEHCDPCEMTCEMTCETKSIQLHEPTDFSIFKSINISDADDALTQIDASQADASLTDASLTNVSLDYKKMPITKLREIAQQNGHSDVSKLKKPEILKLLEAE